MAEDRKTIIVIEDEKTVRLNLEQNLDDRGYVVYVFENAEEALSSGTIEFADAILMDVNLPGMNGFQATQVIKREHKGVPVLMLTVLNDLTQRIQGFEIGADDYIVKPFFVEELAARIKAVVKRYELAPGATRKFVVANLTIDMKAKEARREDRTINLSITEFNLLAVLAEGHGKPVTKDQIMKRVWKGKYSVSDNTIEVYINLLRNKIDKPFSTRLIHTKPGFGYFLSSQP